MPILSTAHPVTLLVLLCATLLLFNARTVLGVVSTIEGPYDTYEVSGSWDRLCVFFEDLSDLQSEDPHSATEVHSTAHYELTVDANGLPNVTFNYRGWKNKKLYAESEDGKWGGGNIKWHRLEKKTDGYLLVKWPQTWVHWLSVGYFGIKSRFTLFHYNWKAGDGLETIRKGYYAIEHDYEGKHYFIRRKAGNKEGQRDTGAREFVEVKINEQWKNNAKFDFTAPANKDMTHEVVIDAKFQSQHDIVLNAVTDHQLARVKTQLHRLDLMNDATGEAKIQKLEESGGSVNDGDVDYVIELEPVKKGEVVGKYGWCENYFVKWIVEVKGIALALTTLILYGYSDDNEFQAKVHHLTVWKKELRAEYDWWTLWAWLYDPETYYVTDESTGWDFRLINGGDYLHTHTLTKGQLQHVFHDAAYTHTAITVSESPDWHTTAHALIQYTPPQEEKLNGVSLGDSPTLLQFVLQFEPRQNKTSLDNPVVDLLPTAAIYDVQKHGGLVVTDNVRSNTINMRMIISWKKKTAPDQTSTGEPEPLLLTFAGWDPEEHKVVHHVVMADHPRKHFFLVRTNLNEHGMLDEHMRGHLKQLHRKLGFKKLAQPMEFDSNVEGDKQTEEFLQRHCTHKLTVAGVVVPQNNKAKMDIGRGTPYTIFFRDEALPDSITEWTEHAGMYVDLFIDTKDSVPTPQIKMAQHHRNLRKDPFTLQMALNGEMGYVLSGDQRGVIVKWVRSKAIPKHSGGAGDKEKYEYHVVPTLKSPPNGQTLVWIKKHVTRNKDAGKDKDGDKADFIHYELEGPGYTLKDGEYDMGELEYKQCLLTALLLSVTTGRLHLSIVRRHQVEPYSDSSGKTRDSVYTVDAEHGAQFEVEMNFGDWEGLEPHAKMCEGFGNEVAAGTLV